MSNIRLEIPDKLLPFMSVRAPFKIAHGGRGSAKSWSVARMLIIRAYTERDHRILCAREFQNSISDSVHALLQDQIEALGLLPWFEITLTSIRCTLTNSEFLFKGLRRNIQEIKSTEGISITWVEEAQAVSESSWLILLPTVMRRPNAEVWVTFNPEEDSDPTYKRFVLNPPPGSMVVQINWRDNPWFPAQLEQQRAHMLRVDPDAYDWVWEGMTRRISAASIFHKRFRVERFEAPPELKHFLYGADWGFAVDPTVLMRCWRSEDLPDWREGQPRLLYIDHEAYGVGVELDDIPALFGGGKSNKTGALHAGIPGAKDWPIKADSARPETISYVRRQGFNIRAAEKWSGSVEDGIEYLKQYDAIVIHERCTHMAQEARLYSYKVDARTGDVLPVVEDKHNHCWDALRYAHDGIITAKGALGTWKKLAMKGR